MCKTRHFRALLARFASASMYPAVGNDDVLDMPLHIADRKLTVEIAEAIREARALVLEGRELMAQAVARLEAAIEDAASRGGGDRR